MRSIRRLNAHREICEQLAKATHVRTGTSIFGTYRELACFAALLGFEQGKAIDLVGPSELLVDGRILEGHDQSVDLVYLIGLAETRSQEILRPDGDHPETLVSVFERYVAGGLEILGQWLRDEPGDGHGDRAVLAALRKGGYLDDAQSAEVAIDRVVF